LGEIVPAHVFSIDSDRIAPNTEQHMTYAYPHSRMHRKAGPQLRSALVGIACVSSLAVAQPIDAADITQFALAHKATGITRGPDGNLWFTENSGTIIGRISPSGKIDEFTVPGLVSDAGYYAGICSGPDGNLWFVDAGNSAIGKITTAGAISEFPLPTSGAVPHSITAGPDGALWFTEQILTTRIGRITTSGSFTEFSTTGQPVGIVAGPDGNLWFTESHLTGCGVDFCSTVQASIGVITPQGTIKEYPLPGTRTLPGSITRGPDGALWFTEILLTGPEFNTGGGTIGRITTAGSISEFQLPTADAQPAGITLGPDGNLWFTESAVNQVAKIQPSGTVTEFPATEFPLPNAASQPDDIALGSDGKLWFTEPGISSIGRIAASAGAPVKLDGYLSGNWYNPSQAGHGFQIELTDTKTMLAIWFVYTPDGSGQAWIYAQGPYDSASNTVTLPAQILTGARFPPNFHSGDVHQQGGSTWGTITFAFSDCDDGDVSWHSDMPGYNQANDTPLPISRLTRIAGTGCP
jgi:streptogramin lyase